MNFPKISLIWFSKYGLASIATFLVNLLVIWALIQLAGWHYLPAVTAGFLVETLLLYVINRKWTFGSAVTTTVVGGYLRSIIVACIVLCLILSLMWLFVSLLALNYIVARILTGLFAVSVNYVLDARFSYQVPHF